MNPIYKFTLNGAAAKPIYGEDLAKVFEKESGEEFFRAKLNNPLTFIKDDYDSIMGEAFDYEHSVVVYISYDRGGTWSEYWRGKFWRTDCKINEDDKVIEVTPNVDDEYSDVLNGMEKEYDLIPLAPELQEVLLDKRGMVQIYTPGESVVGCFLSGMSWEEQCSPQEDIDALTQTGDGKPNFYKMMTLRFAQITNRSDITDGFYTKFIAANQDYQCSSDGYILKYDCQATTPWTQIWEIIRASDNVVLWRYTIHPNIPQDPTTIVLSPVSDSGATGDVNIEFNDADILARYICDVNEIYPYIGSASGVSATNGVINTRIQLYEGYTYDIYFKSGELIPSTSASIGIWIRKNGEYIIIASYTSAQILAGVHYIYSPDGDCALYVRTVSLNISWECNVHLEATETYELAYDDFVFNNRNYHRVAGYNSPDSIAVSNRLVSTPTKWGIFQPGSYYLEPESVSGEEYFPIAKTYWARFSLWFNFIDTYHAYEEASRKQIKLKNAYPLYSAIKVLLGQIAPAITHDGNTTYSAFLYGQNPLTSDTIYWFITPKSNILVGEYDQPAQKAPCTLREILDMLRDCFRCYWFIDNGKFRIEHITYFMRGGTYTPGSPAIQRDLTTEKVSRNGKEWSYCTSKYSFDKAQMPERYEFGWMDKATQYFEGEPIDILSNYVDKGNIQKISIQSFSSDVDYLMLEPSGASNDGFVLLGAITPPQTNLVSSPTANKALLVTGALATEAGFSVSEFIPVNGKNVRANTPSIPYPVSLMCDYCVYDENYNCIRFGYGRTYYYQTGDVYVRFTLNPSNTLAYYFYYILPYYDYVVGPNDHYLQNGLAAFVCLERFYLYDLPAFNYAIGNNPGTALGVRKTKTQTLNFPCILDANLVNLIKTNMGNGKIEKISINLSSRNAEATLMYDTE